MFVRGGEVEPGDYLYGTGSVGLYWSSVGYYSSGAYNLNFNPRGVFPSNNFSRYFGYSVRCVALGG